MFVATLLTAFIPQVAPNDTNQDPDLAAVLRAEQDRIDAMARVEPSVCSVMQIGSPGGGSGVIFDPAGFVLTNFHVVGKQDVKRMRVGLPDGELYDATVLGIDPGSDLAVLLLDADGHQGPWPYAKLGDSDALLVGEAVFAMGNPFLLATDFKPTVTWGIVSGTHRYQPGGGNRQLVYPDCIQVDSPVNPGNSGGPLFNSRGEIVGINGRISVRDRGRVNVGVGFAIASNQIRNFLGDLMAGRHAEHGTLDMNAWFMRAPSDQSRHGVFVQAIFEDSKVGEYGVKLGDEITRFNGTEVRSANQLATMVGVLPTGAWVSLTFRSQLDEGGYGEEAEVEFTLTTLDTGSSGNRDRIADDDTRRLAAKALSRSVTDEPDAEGAELVMHGPEGRVVRLRRSQERLRIDDSKTGDALVHDGISGFRITSDGEEVDLTAEETAKLERVLLTNPWLRRGAGLRERLRDGILSGGIMIHGRAAIAIDLPGDGRRQIFLFEDGSPAGCRYRDPVQKGLVELRVHGDKTRIVIDGQSRPGWRIDAPKYGAHPDALFRRASR